MLWDRLLATQCMGAMQTAPRDVKRVTFNEVPDTIGRYAVSEPAATWSRRPSVSQAVPVVVDAAGFVYPNDSKCAGCTGGDCLRCGGSGWQPDRRHVAGPARDAALLAQHTRVQSGGHDTLRRAMWDAESDEWSRKPRDLRQLVLGGGQAAAATGGSCGGDDQQIAAPSDEQIAEFKEAFGPPDTNREGTIEAAADGCEGYYALELGYGDGDELGSPPRLALERAVASVRRLNVYWARPAPVWDAAATFTRGDAVRLCVQAGERPVDGEISAVRLDGEGSFAAYDVWTDAASRRGRGLVERVPAARITRREEPVAVPRWVFSLERLRHLRLQHYPHATLPNALGQLRALETLSMYGSALERVPRTIGLLQRLHYLDLYTSYGLHYLPIEVLRCPMLCTRLGGDSRFSTRALLGNNRPRSKLPLPALPKPRSHRRKPPSSPPPDAAPGRADIGLLLLRWAVRRSLQPQAAASGRASAPALLRSCVRPRSGVGALPRLTSRRPRLGPVRRTGQYGTVRAGVPARVEPLLGLQPRLPPHRRLVRVVAAVARRHRPPGAAGFLLRYPVPRPHSRPRALRAGGGGGTVARQALS